MQHGGHRTLRWQAALQFWSYVVEEAVTGLLVLDSDEDGDALLEVLSRRDEVESRRIPLDRPFVRHALDAWQLVSGSM